MMAKLTMDYRRLAAWAAVLALVVALLVAVLVNQLSELVPDGIYLTQLALSKGRVRLTGQGSNVVGLIDIVNGSAFMEDAKFDSTVSRNPRTGLDQFSIGARVVGARPE